MPATYTLIASNTLSSSAASVTFSAIPATYTDLVLRGSARTADASTRSWLTIRWNSVSNSYSMRLVEANGTTILPDGRTAQSDAVYEPPIAAGNTATANTFSSFEIYLPNYAGSTNKPASLFGAIETNAATGNGLSMSAILWSNTSAVSSIYIANQSGGNILSGSSFFLYGIKNT